MSSGVVVVVSEVLGRAERLVDMFGVVVDELRAPSTWRYTIRGGFAEGTASTKTEAMQRALARASATAFERDAAREMGVIR